jgi:Carboxypeptidase regulatory-like domain
MNPAKFHRTLAAALLVTTALAVPALAAPKRRAVAHREAGAEFIITVSGVVLDAVTNAPVVNVSVSAADRFDVTDSQGRFDLRNVRGRGDVLLEIARSGYQPYTSRITPSSPTSMTVRLNPTPTVTVRLVNGTVKNFDFESLKFGYPVSFTGYVEADSEDFCRVTDSTKVKFDKSVMAKLDGPAQTVEAGACCTGNAQKMTLTLKNGQVMEVLFSDSCQERYKVDVKGRNHVAGDVEYVPITDIDEIIFP